MDLSHLMLERLSGMVDEVLIEAAREALNKVQAVWHRIDERAGANQWKVVEAFRQVGVRESDLAPSTGYGYGDTGRTKLEGIFAILMGAQAALVRPHMISGTQAIAVALFALLRPGDTLVSLTGEPYDSLKPVIGLDGPSPGSLKDFGISYRQVELTPEGEPDLEAIRLAAAEATVCLLQRSRGYSWRNPLNVEALGLAIAAAKEINPDAVCVVDNCYGELVEEREPGQVGADLVAGSLIKNPGGGLATSGGYLAGKEDYVERAAQRLYAPGTGRQIGAMLGTTRELMQGLFMAPRAVAESLKGATFAACLFANLGFPVAPRYDQDRTDIIQAIGLGSREAVLAFCRGIQKAGPLDPHLRPEAGQMPGYADPLVMAGGSFVQGSTIELSADAPLRPPYTVYLQGGLAREHVIGATLLAAQEMLDNGELKLTRR